MKFKSLLTVAFAAVSMLASAQSKTVNVETAGTLSTLIAGDDLNVKELTLTGNINEKDLTFINESMPNVSILDISATNIEACAYQKEVYYPGSGETGTKDVSYPANEIPEEVFEQNKSLTKVIFPLNLVSVGRRAFYNCSTLASVDFSNLKFLKEIKDNAFNTAGGTSERETPVDLSFENCSSLETIGDFAFNNMQNLGNVNFKGCSSLTTLGASAFQNCMRKVSGQFGIDMSPCEKLTTISSKAFYSCCAKAYVIPASVKELASLSLASLTKTYAVAESIMFMGDNMGDNTITKADDTFKNLNANTIIYVPAGSEQAYEAWGLTNTIVAISTGIFNTLAGVKANNKSYSIDGKLYSGKGIRVVAGKKYTK